MVTVYSFEKPLADADFFAFTRNVCHPWGSWNPGWGKEVETGLPAVLGANTASSPVGEADGEVPGSAVLVFDIELLELVAGLPEGYMFIWNGEVSANLFEEIDKDGDGEVLLEEVTDCWRKVGPKELREPPWAGGPILDAEPSQSEEGSCAFFLWWW